MPLVENLTLLEEKVLAAESLPSLPVVAMKVLELTQDPKVSANQIAAVVQNDPALSAKLLKMANSSMFGMSKKVGTLQKAVVLLGLRTLKVLVLSFSLVETFNGKPKGVLDLAKYWRRSLTMAVGAKLLAQVASESRRDEAFVGGLLADLGMMAAYRCAPEEYEPVLRAYAAQSQPIQEVELAHSGLTHATVTARLLAHWRLPELLCKAVAAHHGEGFDSLSGRTRMLAAVLWSSAMIADLFCGDLDSGQLNEVKERCVELTGVSANDLEGVLEALDSTVTEMAGLMSLNIGETTSYEALRAQAMSQLAAITVDAELGRAQAARQVEYTRQQLAQVSGQAEVLSKEARGLSVRANTDALTKIANRHAFKAYLDRAIKRSDASRSGLGVIMIDLDYFKRLNDAYGHQAGDEALRLVGRCLGRVSKRPTFAARYGGEEFVVVISDAQPGNVQQLAEGIRSIIERLRVKHRRQEIRLTASFGVAHVSFAQEQVNPAELIARADQALYQAKRKGRNRVEVVYRGTAT